MSNYARGPYVGITSLPAPTVNKVHSSRKVDFATKKYELDDDGNALSQPSIQQVVAMKVAFNVPNRDFNTFQDREATRQDVLDTLAELRDPLRPLITNVEVTFESGDKPGEVKGVINFKDVTTDTNQSVEF